MAACLFVMACVFHPRCYPHETSALPPCFCSDSSWFFALQIDPLRRFYSTLREQRPDSEMAKKWSVPTHLLLLAIRLSDMTMYLGNSAWSAARASTTVQISSHNPVWSAPRARVSLTEATFLGGAPIVLAVFVHLRAASGFRGSR